MPLSDSMFALPDRLAAKADPALVADDDRHFAAIAACLRAALDELTDRLEDVRRNTARSGQWAMERDAEVRRVTARMRLLRRAGVEACLGRIVRADDPEPVHIGRIGLSDSTGRQLLVDWRTPAAEPFFRATRAEPMGLAGRRRYRWSAGRITDYWDEAFTADGGTPSAALDDESAFLAGLGASRSSRMRDVLGTIAADQDAIIRAGSRGTLVVDGGPGTGKTVVALHRTAYLLYSDPRLGRRRGGVLVVGPSRPHLAYVGDVLPSLGEEGVQLCTLSDFVAEGAAAGPEDDAEVAALKSSVAMVQAIETAVRFYEEPPSAPLVVETPWADFRLDSGDWAEAFGALEPGTPHNEAREVVLDALVSILLDQVSDTDDAAPADRLRAALRRHRELVAALHRAWPLVEAADLVGDLWSVPAYLRRSAPWLTAEQVRALQRDDPQAWTVADLPLLDAARRRLGDPAAADRQRRREAAAAARSAEMSSVVDHLIASDDSEMAVMSMLRGRDLQDALLDEAEMPGVDPDVLAGPFAHVVVDEAQELTDAQWQVLLARCPSRSFTVVGDRAQARHGFAESWQERLERAGLDSVDVRSLSINYRTPVEVMAEAEPVIRAALPNANVPTSVRRTGVPVRHGPAASLAAVIEDWLATHPEGVGCVIGDPHFPGSDRIRCLTPELAKGLEFDLVVLVDPDSWGRGISGAVDRYVAMTRATQQLVVLRP